MSPSYTLIDVPFRGESVVYSFPAELTPKELRAEVMRIIPAPQNKAVVKMLDARNGVDDTPILKG